MNREIKNEWVKRLRSGEYDQIGSSLHTKDGFCCLGVLCEIAVDNEVIKPPEFTGAEYRYVKSTSYLPLKVQKWAGIRQRGTYDKNKSNLAQDNDNGCTFDEIANIIEANF